MPPKVISGGDNPYDIHDAKLSSSATAHESSSVTAHEISNNQEKSQTFFAIKTEKEDKEENVHLKNLTESSEDIKEDQYIDVTKLPNIRIDSSMLRDAVYHKMTM